MQDSMAAISGALVRMLVGDHTALLAFLGWAWPVGTLSNSLVQLACLYLVSRQNETMCNSPVSHCSCGACWCCICFCSAGRCHAGRAGMCSHRHALHHTPASLTALPPPCHPATLPPPCSTCVAPVPG